MPQWQRDKYRRRDQTIKVRQRVTGARTKERYTTEVLSPDDLLPIEDIIVPEMMEDYYDQFHPSVFDLDPCDPSIEKEAEEDDLDDYGSWYDSSTTEVF